MQAPPLRDLYSPRCWTKEAAIRRQTVISLAIGLAMILAIPAVAGAASYEWRDHASPFDFEFGNHIDTHQQSMLTGKTGLTGFLYITQSGETTDDGVPVAMHGDCSQDPAACSVGWSLKGLTREAEYCGHVSGEHPAWAIDPDSMPSQRGFTHFHWLNESLHHDGLTPGQTYDGYLLKLTAVDTFVFSHGSEYLVEPGIDFETHANVYATCEDWPHFGEGGGDHDH